jgi:hypothetical protein
MQRGFTENTSSINTGLLLTEFKNESKEKKTTCFCCHSGWTKSLSRNVETNLNEKNVFYKHSVPILGYFESIIQKCYNPC